MPEKHKKPIREKSRSFSEDLFFSKTEQMQDLVNVLVRNYRDASHASSRTGNHATIGGHDLELYDTWLRKSAHVFQGGIKSRTDPYPCLRMGAG